jgi:hypothetical protein
MRSLLVLVLLGCSGTVTPDAGIDAPMAIDSGTDSGPPDAFRLDAGPPPPPLAEPGRHDVEVIDTRLIVPSDGLPDETVALHSNNNLDVIRHAGRVFLAWRTGPDHFAGTETRIHVVSSTDEVDWTFEHTIFLGTDIREPRFIVIGDQLFLHVAILGMNRLSFEPMGVRVAVRAADGTWSDLRDSGMPGYIAWRTRTERGVPYMTAYLGGEHLYLLDGLPLTIDLLTTTDGIVWTPVDPDHRSVYMGGGSETDFVIGDDGTLFGIIRNEAGDETGFGSLVCRAPAGDLDNWNCHHDPKKYDSPLMFWYDGEAYLIGRRNISETGNYDITPSGNMATRALRNQIDYWQRLKRCSLWRYVQSEDRIAYVLDLPSSGDTCFAAQISGDNEGELIVYNYSSPIDGPDQAWMDAQLGDTHIYRHVLRFTPRATP